MSIPTPPSVRRFISLPLAWWTRRVSGIPFFQRVLGAGFDAARNAVALLQAKTPVDITEEKLKPYSYLLNRLNEEEDGRLLQNIIAMRVFGWKNVWFREKLRAVELCKKHKKCFGRNGAVALGRVMPGLADCRVETKPDVAFPLAAGQYFHPKCSAEPGDVCVDFGAFWGETSILLANAVGEKGKVFAVEFGGEQIQKMRGNFGANETLASRMQIIPQPFWSESNKPVYAAGSGGCMKVAFQPLHVSDEKRHLTLTLDDAVAQGLIPRVDFIKMDIEGAEFPVLQGAVGVLKKFKPKLAVSIYHSDEDFDRIPRFLDSLGCGYEFGMGHYSGFHSETILYAKAPKFSALVLGCFFPRTCYAIALSNNHGEAS